MRYIAFIVIVALFCGCIAVHPVESLDSAQVANKAVVAHGQSKQATQVEGLKLVFGEFQENYYLLKATRAEGEPAVHYSFFMQTLRKSSLGGRGWKAAADGQGKSFPLIKDTKQTNEDMLYESVTFELTREWLDLAASKETKILVTGATNNQVLIFPTNYISGFVNRVDQEFFPRN